MIIYKHNYKDRTVIELEDDELTLIAFLVEKSHQKHKELLKEPLASKMHDKIQSFLKDEM